MLRHAHGHDLSVRIYGHFDFKVRKALHVINARGHTLFRRCILLRLRSRSGSGHAFLFLRRLKSIGRGSLAKRFVDGVAGHRHTGLHIDVRCGDILTHQHGERLVCQHICPESRRLDVAGRADRHNFSVFHFHVQSELIHALDGIGIPRNGGRFGGVPAAGIVGGSLGKRVVDSVAGQRRPGFHVDLCRGDILTHQRVKHRAVRNQIRAIARRLIVFRHAHGHDLSIRIHLDRNLHRTEARHVIGLRAALIPAGIVGGSLGKRIVDGVAGQRRPGFHVDLCRGDILTHQRVKHRAVRNQIRAIARRLIVFRHAHGHDLSIRIHLDRNLHRTEARHVIRFCASFSGGLTRFLVRLFVAGGLSKQRFLVAGMRLNGEARILKHLPDRPYHRAGGDRRTADRAHIAVKRIGIRRDADKLVHEIRLCNPGSQTSRFLQRADINIGHISVHTHAERYRNFAAISLRRSRQRIANRFSGCIFGDKQLVKIAVGCIIVAEISRLILTAGEYGAERLLLRGNGLRFDRALCHLIGDAQQRGGHECEDEQTKREPHNITHSS